MLPRYYDLLSLPADASVDAVAAARAALLAKYEPHARLGDRDAVRLVNAIEEAAATLSDPLRRAAYDAALLAVMSPSVEAAPALAAPPRPSGPTRQRSQPLPPPPPSTVGRAMDGNRDLPPLPSPLPERDEEKSYPKAAHAQGQRLALPSPEAASSSGGGEKLPPSPVLFLLMILDWLAHRTLHARDSVARAGEVVARPDAPALPPTTAVEGVKVSAADWRFDIHDAFFAPALAINGQRLSPHGQWLLVRLAIRNEWAGHRALRQDDFGLMVMHAVHPAQIEMDLEATHAARLVLGLKATPAGRHGLGFAAHESRETVVVFDVPHDTESLYLRLKPAGALVDLAPVTPWPGLAAERPAGFIEAKAKPPPTPPPRLEILDIQQGPGRGRSKQVTVRARAMPGAVCSIRVQYARGPSNARGLAPAIAGPDGMVQWSWRVSSRTRPGEWPVTVACGYTHALTTLVIDQPPVDAV